MAMLDGDLAAAALEEYPTEAGVLDTDGEILYVNKEWRRFAEGNGGSGDPVGMNYLAKSEEGGTEDGAEAAEGLRRVSEGEAERFEMEYPCHSPEVRRWFLMRAIRFCDDLVLVIHVNITDRKLAEMRVEEEREKLEVLNRLVRHDIRNEMNLVLGWGDRLREHLDGEEGEDILDTVLEAGGYVVELTETSREFVEALTGDEKLETRPVGLRGVVEEEVERARRSYPKADVSLGEIPGIEVAANDLLPSVFRNLLENGVKHSDREQPSLEVSVEDLGDSVEVSVADDGPGVPEERREEVFGRGEKGLESGGTGLGLYLVDSLTEQYGGDVRIEDNEPRGAVFTVTLRKAGSEEG